MIFDVQPRAVHQVVAYPEIEESPQSSKDEPVDPTAAEQNWVCNSIETAITEIEQ